MKVKLQGDTCSLLRHDDRAYVLALGVFEFDYGFRRARQRGDGENDGKGD